MKKYQGEPESEIETHNIVRELLLNLYPCFKIKQFKALEVGAGTGELAYHLWIRSFNTYACDIETQHFKQPSFRQKPDKLFFNKPTPKKHFDTFKKILKEQPKHYYIPIRKEDLNKTLSYKNNTFDLVVASEVMEHLENNWNFIREMYRIMKKDGILIITTPNVSGWSARMRFFFQNKLPFFSYTKWKEINHVTPVFDWNFDRMIEDKFRIIETRYKPNKLFGLWLPECKAFGEIVVWCLRKI